jgi:hypothetical protein
MDRGRQAGSQGSCSQPGLARAQARAPTVSRSACEPTRSAQRSYSSDAATFAVSRSPALSPFLPFKYTFPSISARPSASARSCLHRQPRRQSPRSSCHAAREQIGADRLLALHQPRIALCFHLLRYMALKRIGRGAIDILIFEAAHARKSCFLEPIIASARRRFQGT